MSLGVYNNSFNQSGREQQLLSEGFAPNFSPGAGFVAAFKRGSNLTTALDSGINYLRRKQGSLLSPETVKEKYGVDTDEPINENYASYLQKEREHREKQDFILSNIDPTKTGSTAFPLLGGLAKGFADPVGIISGGAALKVLGTAGKMMYGARAVQAFKGRGAIGALRTGAAEGVVESLYSTPALMWESKEIYGEEFTAKDVALDFAANIAGNSLFNLAGYRIGKFLGKYGDRGTSEIIQNEANQAYNSVRPNTSYQRKALDKDIFTIKGGDPIPKYAPLPEGPKKLYAVSKKGTLDVKDVRAFDESFGSTVMLTDTPQFAKNAANADLTRDSGIMLEVDLNEANLVDLDKPLTPDLETKIREALIEANVEKGVVDGIMGDPENLSSGVSLFRKLDEQNIDVDPVNKVMKDLGIDGYNHKSTVEGVEHNVVNIFDPEKLAVGNTYKGAADPKRAANVESEFKAQQEWDRDAKNDILADTEAIDEAAEIPDTPMSPEEIDEMDAVIMDGLESINKFKEEGAELPDVASIKEVDRLAQTRDNLDLIIDSAFDCVRVNG